MSENRIEEEINSVLESIYEDLVGNEEEFLWWRGKGTGTTIDTAFGKIEIWGDDDYE